MFLLCNIAFGLVGQGDPTIRGVEQDGSLQRTSRRRRELDNIERPDLYIPLGLTWLLPIRDFCSRENGIVELAGSACQ
jgi:hypothetical protein